MRKIFGMSAIALTLGFASCDKNEESPLMNGDSEVTSQEDVDVLSTRATSYFQTYGINVLGLSKKDDEKWWEERRAFEYNVTKCSEEITGSCRLGREGERVFRNALDLYHGVGIVFKNQLDSNGWPTEKVIVEVHDMGPYPSPCYVYDLRTYECLDHNYIKVRIQPYHFLYGVVVGRDLIIEE